MGLEQIAVIIQRLNYKMSINQSQNLTRDLALLEHIEHDPDVTQASLASHLGVAVGTVNWHLKRLISKGYVKVKRAQRRKLRYIITPKGIALRARLTVDYVERSFRLYRKTRVKVQGILEQVRAEGYAQVRILNHLDEENDIADICRLTCIEQGVPILEMNGGPVLEVQGTRVRLRREEKV